MGTTAEKLQAILNSKENIRQAINDKDVIVDADVKFADYASKISEITSGGGGMPSTSSGLFTGATIPLTYKDNTHEYENNYEYNSASYKITITGLDGRATITGNGTQNVLVAFDVSSSTSSLQNFTITLSNDTDTYEYKGMHAHYGVAITGILTLAYKNITPDGSVGMIGTNYVFIESNSTDAPCFIAQTALWNTIYSCQVLNVLMGNYSNTSIGEYFLTYCYSFNQPLSIPDSVTSIGNNFLSYCYSFNQPLTIPNNITSIGDYFLHYCFSFNQPLTIPDNITSIGNNFLSYCYSFNQPLSIPDSVTSIGSNFLSHCYPFNQPLTIPDSIISIGEYFLTYCQSFNQPLTMPDSITSIGNYFLYYCYSFNQPLTIPNNITSIGDYFLRHCYSFNQPLSIPDSVTSIGNNFLSYCSSFNQPLTMPDSITSIGNYFLYYCYSLSTIIYKSSAYPTDTNSLSDNQKSKNSIYGAGIMVYGTNRAGLMTALPNRTSSPYRKLIDGGY